MAEQLAQLNWTMAGECTCPKFIAGGQLERAESMMGENILHAQHRGRGKQTHTRN